MNIKKLFPDKGESKKGFMEFLDKRGFYIVLILCIAIVGATAVFVTTSNLGPANLKSDADKLIPGEISDNAAATADSKQAAQPAAATAQAGSDKKVAGTTANTTKPAATGNADKAKVTAPAAGTGTTAAPKAVDSGKVPQFISPVFGEVTTAFAQSNLVYSKTLEEWRTHSGTDLAAERGAPVKSVADGVVSDIKNDPRLGITVIIDHGNGIKTLYANLASDDMVSVNQKVKQNDVIGCVGNTANFEIAEASHLHFEVWKNNEPVNPATYLPKKE